MEKTQEQEFAKLTNLESIKEFCNSNLVHIATRGFALVSHFVKVRFIDPEGNFGFTGLGRFFFIDDCMYIITDDKKYEIDHKPDIIELSKELSILSFTGEFIVNVIFAGVFTGFKDDKGERIFTGDVVSAKVLPNPKIPSNGGANRARNFDNEEKGSYYEAGVNVFYDVFSMILDNHSAPLSWATELKIVGSLFYDLQKGDTEVDIRSLCNNFAQSRTNRNELTKLIKKSPYFPPVTWKEKATEILCRSIDEENE